MSYCNLLCTYKICIEDVYHKVEVKYIKRLFLSSFFHLIPLFHFSSFIEKSLSI